MKDKKLDSCTITLESYDSIENYIKSNFRIKCKTGLNQSLIRLENSFRIRPQMFFNEITREENHSLMTSLKAMLSSRFSLNKKFNFAILKWDSIYEKGHDMINKKKNLCQSYMTMMNLSLIP
ncbi:hypothetical protein MWU78_15520 [Arenibacter sp. F26102]|uniref:hypothetical protein n=1 Tax=Arenibacter sp. F26102 TaxID=2926416 RepID=UPI001FF49B7C|nr:hypothetical protein [Arenibacter sp. F26102]MCK0147065.1 hypothetical protein [Arenibacter sp. F26102]